MPDQEWKVLEHGPLEPLAENLWRVEGAIPNISLRRQMAVIRREDGGLVLHSAIAMDDARMAELEALGEPRVIVVPNAGHRLDAPRYKKRYPKAEVVCPRGARAKVEEKVAVDRTYDEVKPDAVITAWEHVGGARDAEGALTVRSKDGVTIVLNDSVFNMAKKPSDFLGWAFTSVLGSAPGPRVSRLGKLTFVKDKAAFRAALERWAATPDLVRLMVAHGEVARGADAAAALRKAATYV